MEKDYSNTFLITNPLALLRVLQQFPSLPESTQCTILDRLDDILLKCPHNGLILTDHLATSPTASLRASKQALARLRGNPSAPSDFDLLLQVVRLGLKAAGRTSGRKLVELLRKLSQGRRFGKCHLEYMY